MGYVGYALLALVFYFLAPAPIGIYRSSRNVNPYCYLKDPSAEACLVFRNGTRYDSVQVNVDRSYGCSTGSSYCSIPVTQGSHSWSAKASAGPDHQGSWSGTVDVPSTGCEIDLDYRSGSSGCQ